MKTRDFDKQFDDGKDVSTKLDVAKAKRLNQEQKRVNVDFPVWVIAALDQEATRLGITRQALIKVWIADRVAECVKTKSAA